MCEFDLAEQFQPQATLRTADKKKCPECFALNPPSVLFCLKCEARLDGVGVVKVKNTLEKPPPNTSMFLGDETMVTCSKCGRVNSADARFCDWCGAKPKKTYSVTHCLKCTAANEPYARYNFFQFCSLLLNFPYEKHFSDFCSKLKWSEFHCQQIVQKVAISAFTLEIQLPLK